MRLKWLPVVPMKQERKTIKLVFPLSTHINITWFKPFTLRLWSVTRARGHEQVLFISVSARTFLPEVCMGFSSVRPPANLSPTSLKYSFGWIKSRPAALITGAKRTLKGSLQLTYTIPFFFSKNVVSEETALILPFKQLDFLEGKFR